MSIFIFVGPTLPVAEARRVLDAEYLPPAAQGDVYRVTLEHPQAIGIIDGYFEIVPSVWHKEILWAMSQGIHVFGSASMGALRAAELAAFGMEGIGWVYSAYCTGKLEDDDEVTVMHGPAENGYCVLSEAMVNIRVTLQRARAQGIIRPRTRTALVQLAKRLFYPERTYSRLLEIATEAGLPRAELDELRGWLPHGQVDQKREDALAMLNGMGERLKRGPEPKRVGYYFEYTTFWDRLRNSVGPISVDGNQGGENLFREEMLDEVRLDTPTYQLLRESALNRGLARALADQQGELVPPEKLRDVIQDFRRARGLVQGEATQQWLAERDLDPARFSQLMREQALLHWATSWAVPDLDTRVIDELRLDGLYDRLRDRARHKHRLLEEVGLAHPSLADIGLTLDELLNRYFTNRGSGGIPSDLRQYARECGFRDEQSFIQAALREYCYLQYQVDHSV